MGVREEEVAVVLVEKGAAAGERRRVERASSWAWRRTRV